MYVGKPRDTKFGIVVKKKHLVPIVSNQDRNCLVTLSQNGPYDFDNTRDSGAEAVFSSPPPLMILAQSD